MSTSTSPKITGINAIPDQAGNSGKFLKTDGTSLSWATAGGGAGGGEIVDSSSYASPTSISTSVSIPTDIRSRLYITGNAGPVVNPTLGTGATGQELFLFGTSDSNTVELNSTTNLLLSGPIVLKDGSIMCLHWIDGLNKWVEASRNEI